MNHLAHLTLAGDDHGLVVGGFLGDFVKGRLGGELPCAVERGVRLHRAIDRFTDTHDIPKQSRERFARRFRRFGGIMTDIAYDHILATSWQPVSNETLDKFSSRMMTVLLANLETMPERAQLTATRMAEVNALVGYRQPKFIDRSLGFLSTRLSRENPLAEAAPEVHLHINALRSDFARFFPELIEFCDEWKKHH